MPDDGMKGIGGASASPFSVDHTTASTLPNLPNQTTYTGKVIIFTSFYQSQAHARYTQSIVSTAMVLERLGVRWDYWPYCGDFHVERACNLGLAKFLADDEATDFLLIDSDESWGAETVMRLLSHPEEVVACAYRMKNRWEDYTCNLKTEDGTPVGKFLKDGTVLLAADRVPGGFLRLKKSAVRKFSDAYPETYKHGEIDVPMFFQTAIRDGMFFSQDYNFSEKLKACGVELWIDPNADISHHGTTEYPGNLDVFLRKQRHVSEEKAAFAEIERAAFSKRAA